MSEYHDIKKSLRPKSRKKLKGVMKAALKLKKSGKPAELKRTIIKKT